MSDLRNPAARGPCARRTARQGPIDGGHAARRRPR
jgi:hypothetical protein